MQVKSNTCTKTACHRLLLDSPAHLAGGLAAVLLSASWGQQPIPLRHVWAGRHTRSRDARCSSRQQRSACTAIVHSLMNRAESQKGQNYLGVGSYAQCVSLCYTLLKSSQCCPPADSSDLFLLRVSALFCTLSKFILKSC